MTTRPEPAATSQPSSAHSPGRRQFLGQVSSLGVAAAAIGTTATGMGAADPEQVPELLPTVPLGDHRITRLILGGNPIYGHSHFNRLYSQHLREFHTPERVVELLRAASAAGINCWQNSYATRTVDDVLRCRDAGVPFLQRGLRGVSGLFQHGLPDRVGWTSNEGGDPRSSTGRRAGMFLARALATGANQGRYGPAERSRQPAAVHRAVIVPTRSVRWTAAPIRSNRERASGWGCP